MKEGDTLSEKTGLKKGERQRDYSDPDFIAKQKADRIANPSTNLAKYNIARQKKAGTYGSDPTLEQGGIEGLIEAGLAGEKSSLGTAMSSDKSFIKGILSLARAAELYNPGTRVILFKS